MPAVYSPTAADISAARAYDAMTHNPSDPRVRLSYQWLQRSIILQGLQMLTANNPAGRAVRVEWFGGNDDAYVDSAAMRADVRENGHLFTYATADGATDLPKNHPMLAPLLGNGAPDMFAGRPLNDVFRAVHDVFGHVHADSGFGPVGERKAWEMHRRTLPKASWLALWCETRGQNAWTNALHSDLPITARPFAVQKAGMPASTPLALSRLI
jgi:hypothetical protein